MRAVVFGLILATMLATAACGNAEVEAIDPGQARMPASSKDLEGESYTDVVELLEGAGFTSVETVALGDLITGWVNKPDTVDEVEIGGVASFDKGEVFEGDVKVVVNYHSFPDDEKPSADEPDSDDSAGSELPAWCNDGRFGTAITIDNQPDLPVTVTVEAPVALAEATKPGANASFAVTITNQSPDGTWGDPWLYSLAAAAADRDPSVITSGEWPTNFEGDDLGPGQSLTFTDEWHVADLQDVRYELRVDGLAGDLVCITN